MKINLNVSEIAARLFPFAPLMDKHRSRISLALYRALARGKAVSANDLAIEADISTVEAEEFLLNQFAVYRDDDGHAIGYLGLAISEMGYKLSTPSRDLYAWCAWDTLFIPEILGVEARTEAIDPVSKKKITMTITPAGPVDLSEPETCMTMLIPEDAAFEGRIKEDIIGALCHHIHFFENERHATQWIADREESYTILSLDKAFKLGRKWNQHVHGDVLAVS